jgi:long-chain acyl-CoA synthetase
VGIISLHRDHDIKPETCGPPLPGVELKLSAEGEIIVRTASMFSGYHKEQEKDAKRIKDGWYYTGDFGYLDKDGHLIVMDRMEDLMELADGHKFSPQYCETRLRFSPYLKDALVVARENEAFIGVIVNIDFPNVSQWAESQRIPYTTFADLSQKPQVIELIRKELVNVNKTLPEYSRIRKFINLHKEFDPDEAEMTRTRKLRRTFVEERFKELIDAIFSGKESLEVISQIIYQDGRTGTTRSLITVNNL